MVDVTDATFEVEVLRRSSTVPVVVDLWAPWCGPCATLGPILERAVAATEGAVVLAKVNVDENPQISAGFRVQSIPAVFALRDGTVVDQFIGAQPEASVRAFVERLAPAASEADLLAAEGTEAADEGLLERALELQPDHPEAIASLARLLIDRGAADEAESLLQRVPESPETRRLMAEARLATNPHRAEEADTDARLTLLLDRVRDDLDARQEFLDLLETLGPVDPRTASYRKALASRLF